MSPAKRQSANDCAQQVLRVVPLLMREIRSEMRAAAPAGLTVPQFRILIFANAREDASVSDVAAHLGVSLPTASVAVDKLVRLNMLRAEPTPDNRRRRSLQLTPEGRRAVADALDSTTAAFAQRVAALTPQQLHSIADALCLLEAHAAAPSPR